MRYEAIPGLRQDVTTYERFLEAARGRLDLPLPLRYIAPSRYHVAVCIADAMTGFQVLNDDRAGITKIAPSHAPSDNPDKPQEWTTDWATDWTTDYVRIVRTGQRDLHITVLPSRVKEINAILEAHYANRLRRHMLVEGVDRAVDDGNGEWNGETIHPGSHIAWADPPATTSAH